jgi:polyhydroxyalkanoate synthesis regulator phasin
MTDQKSEEEKQPGRLAEMQKNLEDYASDLRAFIERLREKLDKLERKH